VHVIAACLRQDAQRIARQRHDAQYLAALAPGDHETHQRDNDEAQKLHVHGKPVHGRSRGPQHDADRADDENGHAGLHEGCGEAQDQAFAERLLVRDQIGERARFVQQTSVSWTKGEHRSGSAGFDAVLTSILLGVIPQCCLQSDVRNNVMPDGTDHPLRNG
jgi:hypothetical protein